MISPAPDVHDGMNTTSLTRIALPIGLFSLAGIALLACLPTACSNHRQPRTRNNVILICLDSARADHMGAYGYSMRDTTPTMDALAARSTVFLDVSATAGWSKPSVPSFHTGTYPMQHGVYEGSTRDSEGKHSDVLPDEADTIAERFRGSGYQTAAFIRNAQLRMGQGLEQGFDLYDDDAGDARSIRWRATDWIDRRTPEEPFFLYLHFLDAHWPYAAPAEYMERYSSSAPPLPHGWKGLRERVNEGEVTLDDATLTALIARYDGALRYIDDELGKLFSALEQRGLASNTVVCIVSAHGEEFMEHGKIGHGNGLHEELLRVPWILHVPGRPAQTISTPVSLVDLFPTLLRASDLHFFKQTEGIDRLAEPNAVRPCFAEHKSGKRYEQSLKLGGLKLMRSFERAGNDTDEGPPPSVEQLVAAGLRLSIKLGGEGEGSLIAKRIEVRDDVNSPLEIKGEIEAISENRIVMSGVSIPLSPDVVLYGKTTTPSGRRRRLIEGLPVKVKLREESGALFAYKIKLYPPESLVLPEVRGIVTDIEQAELGPLLRLGIVNILVNSKTEVRLRPRERGAFTRSAVREMLLTRPLDTTMFVGKTQLFDLALDPNELAAVEGHAEQQRLERSIDDISSRLVEAPLWEADDRHTLTAEEISDLKAIGYAAGDQDQ